MIRNEVEYQEASKSLGKRSSVRPRSLDALNVRLGTCGDRTVARFPSHRCHDGKLTFVSSALSPASGGTRRGTDRPGTEFGWTVERLGSTFLGRA